MKKLLASIIFFLLAGAGCTSYQNQPLTFEKLNYSTASNNSLKIQIGNNVSTLDPAFVQTAEERMICSYIFNGLVKLDSKTLQPVHALADSWTVTPDGKTYIFTLNKKARFHNSAPIKASDVKFSWERAVYLNSQEKYIFSNIDGYWDFVSGRSSDIRGIKVLNDYKLEVDLIADYPQFLTTLTEPAAAVVDRFQAINNAVYFGKPGSYTTPALLPNASGPFQIFEWVNHRLIILGVNREYCLSKPQMDRITLVLNDDKDENITDFELNNLDAIQNVTQTDVATMPELKGKLLNTQLASVIFLRFNPQNPIVSNINVRKALFFAADFRRIGLYLNSDFLHYLPGQLTSYLADGSISGENESVTFNAYIAATLLTASGFPEGRGLTFDLYYINDPEIKKAALLLTGQWSARGIHVNPIAVSESELNYIKNNHLAAVWLERWSAPYLSLDAFYYPEFHSAFGLGISNDIDNMVSDALFTQNAEQKKVKYQAVEKFLTENFFFRPLFAESTQILCKPYIKGLEPNKLGLLTLDKARIVK